MIVNIKPNAEGFPKTINNEIEFIDFVTNESIINNFKCLTPKVKTDIAYLLDNTEQIYKTQLKNKLRQIFYSTTTMNDKYWLDRGWSEEEAKEKISKLQKKNANIFAVKKQNDPYFYSATTNTQIGYWTNKGYSEDEAKLKISERQRTFTLEKCIEKYGEEEGKNRWKERQNKWITTLSLKSKEEIKRINEQKSYSVAGVINQENVYYHIDRFSFTDQNKKIIKNSISNSNTLFEFTELYLKQTNNDFSYHNIGVIANSKVIQAYYNCTQDDIFKTFYIIMDNVGIKMGRFGNIVAYGGKKLKSYGEYLIAKFLDENNVEYEYEKRYPNSRKKCDFFLPKYDLYVEYLGMSDKLNPKEKSITEQYNQNAEQKRQICIENNLKYLFESKINSIFVALKQIITT